MDKEEFNSYFSEHFFDIINQTRNGITISDPTQENNPVIYVNKAFCEIFEYNYEECIGKNLRFLQGDDNEQENLELIRDAIKNETPVTTVLRNYTKNGKLIYNEVRISPIFNQNTGKIKFFLGVQKILSTTNKLNNIIEDKLTHTLHYKNPDVMIQELEIFQAELLAQNEELIEKDKKLQTLNNEFSLLFHDAPVAYVVIDKNLQIRRYNKLAASYFNFSKTKTIVNSLFSVTHRDSIEPLISWISNEKYINYSLEISMIRTDKKQRRFKLNCKKYMLKEDLLLLSLNDITKIHNLKTKLEKQVEKELKKRVAQEKYILRQNKLASMGEMIDAIAHQWLNPLSLIKLYTQDSHYIVENDLTDLKDDLLDNHQKMEKQINHLTNTLEEFRSFYRPDTNSEYISAKELIENTLLLMKDELIKHNINYELIVDNDFQIKTIKNQFKHVILNLLTNSRDAFEDNEILNKKIQIKIKEDEKYYFIKFYDNAGGIPKDIINKIFEPNFTTKTSGKGTGVGLYLCKQILDKFNILIDVKNKKNGACFVIKYPKKLNKLK